MMDLSELRLSYTKAGLLESGIDPDPIQQFRVWMAHAIAIQFLEPNAMTLATSDIYGQPSARTVLLKGFDADGFVFYTNYDSRKGREISGNPKVALLFYWDVLERQVRIAGTASRISEEESDSYFKSRPAGHQIGAWVSHQSTVIDGRNAIEDRLSEMAERFAQGPIPRPPHWGGYRVFPHAIEFWQGRENRLHDRIEYFRQGDVWTIRRLSP